MPLARVIAERPDVFNHNVEVVPRLYPVARRGSRWERSLRVLRNAKEMGGDEVLTKSGLMVGLGETHDELVEAFGAAARAGRPDPHGRPVPAPDRAPPAGRPLLASGGVHRARAGGARARLRARRRRAARALELPRGRARAGRARRRVTRVPNPRQHPDRALPGRHRRVHRAQRDRVLLLAEGRDHARRPELAALPQQPRRLRRDPVRDHAPRQAVRAGRQHARLRAAVAPAPTSPATWITLFTSMFMHGGLLHLGGNMLFLWIFGNNVEDAMGPVKYVVFYLLAGLAATAGQVIVDPSAHGAGHRRLGGDRRRARRLPGAVPARPRGHGRLHHLLLHDPRAAGACSSS